jgi:hypothetical protein
MALYLPIANGRLVLGRILLVIGLAVIIGLLAVVYRISLNIHGIAEKITAAKHHRKNEAERDKCK